MRWSSLIPSGPHVSQGTRGSSPLQQPFGYGVLTLFDRPSHAFPLNCFLLYARPSTPVALTTGLGYSAFAHHYLRNHLLFSSPPGTEMFHFPGFAPLRVTEVCSAGLPHSDIHDYSPVDSSSWLFAVCRVLPRRPSPRHPLCALCSLTFA